MAEAPLAKLGRLVGGLILLRGTLGHRVLGNLLISDASAVEVAAANLAIASATGTGNVVAEAAVRTLAPAIAVQALARKDEERLKRLAESLAQDFPEHARRHPGAGGRKRPRAIAQARIELERLQQENRTLRGELGRLRRLVGSGPADSGSAGGPAT